jgi:hypothetical protein
MKINLRSYWFWFYSTVIVLSGFDYVDHISFEGSRFARHKLDWLFFTIASTLTICLATYLFNYLLSKTFKRTNIVFESIAISLGLVLQVFVSGPILNKLLFQYTRLCFYFNIITLIVGLTLFYIIRLIIYFLNRPRTNATIDK